MPGTRKRKQDYTESEALVQASEETFYQCTHPDKGGLSLGVRIETGDGVTDINDHIGYYRDPEMASSRLSFLKDKLQQDVARLRNIGTLVSIQVTYSSYCYYRYNGGMPLPVTESDFLQKVARLVA